MPRFARFPVMMLLAWSAMAQQEPGPLTISGAKIAASPSGRRAGLRFDVTNRSEKKVIGYVVVMEFLAFNASKVESRATLLSLKPAYKDNLLLPGESAEERYYGAPFGAYAQPQFRLSIDHVLFADGSTWGANIANESGKLAGMGSGAQMERNRLRHMLKTQGVQAVVADLDR